MWLHASGRLAILASVLLFIPTPATAMETLIVIDMQYPDQSKELPLSSRNLDRKSKLQAFLQARGHQNVDIRLKLFPFARARQVVNNEPWCLSFIPPMDKTHVIFQPLENKVNQIVLFRLRQPTPFDWQHLSDLGRGLVATLRDNDTSTLNSVFDNTGLQTVEIASFEQGLQMLLKGRVDYALGYRGILDDMDNSPTLNKNIQTSEKALFEFRTSVYVNKQCKAAALFDGQYP